MLPVNMALLLTFHHCRRVKPLRALNGSERDPGEGGDNGVPGRWSVQDQGLRKHGSFTWGPSAPREPGESPVPGPGMRENSQEGKSTAE